MGSYSTLHRLSSWASEQQASHGPGEHIHTLPYIRTKFSLTSPPVCCTVHRSSFLISLFNLFQLLYSICLAWENVKEDMKPQLCKESPGLYKLKQHKSLFDEECLWFLGARKHAGIRWLQDPNQNNVRLEASRHFRNIWKLKLYEL